MNEWLAIFNDSYSFSDKYSLSTSLWKEGQPYPLLAGDQLDPTVYP